MSTDPAAVVGSDGQLFSGFGNINDMDFTGGYNNSHSSTMSIETLDLADVLKNPHVKSLHEKWTHATEQVMNISEIQTNLVQENAWLRIEIAALNAENHHAVAMGPQRSRLDRGSSIAPSDSVSRLFSSTSSRATPNLPNQLDLGNSFERPGGPDGCEPEVLWNPEDCKTDPDVDLSPSNMSRPAMDKAIRYRDGHMISRQEWLSIKAVANAVKHNLLTLPAPKEPAAHGRRKTKTYFRTWFPKDWNQSLLDMEHQMPILALCSRHWKAEHVLGNSLLGDKAHKKKSIASGADNSSDSDTMKNKHSKKRRHSDPDENEDGGENGDEDGGEDGGKKSQTKKDSRTHSKPRRAKKTKMACDWGEKQKDDVSVPAATKPLETSDFSGGDKGATAGGDNGTTAGGDNSAAAGGANGAVAGGANGATAGGDNGAAAGGANGAAAGGANGATAGGDKRATAGGARGATACASATTTDFIDVDSSYESLKRIFIHDFPAVPHSTDLLTSMQSNPTFTDGPPSDPVVAFLARIQDADPNSPELSEDNTNANWGHYQFSGHVRSVLTAWSSVGGNSMACKLIAAAIKTCKVARHLCYERGIHPISYLSDAYLNEVVERLWTMWKEAGGPFPATVPAPTTTPGITVALSSPLPSRSQTSVTRAAFQGLVKDELKDLIRRQGLVNPGNKKKEELISIILAAPAESLPSSNDVAAILQERKKKKVVAGTAWFSIICRRLRSDEFYFQYFGLTFG